jgi:hypothetical protein
MKDEEIEATYRRMWEGDRDEYVLERKDNIFRYTIMNALHNGMVIIEVEDIARYVITKMLAHGVRVVDDFEQVRNPNPPERIFFTPELHEKWLAQQRGKKQVEITMYARITK